MRIFGPLAGTLLASFLVVPQADAQVTNPTGTLDVRLIIEESCEVTWPGSTIGSGSAELDFGTTTRIDSAIDADIGTGGSGGIEVRCNTGSTYSVTFDAGENGGGNTANRAMRGAVNTSQLVPYQIYSDAGRTTVLTTLTLTGSGAYESIPVYGRVAPLNPSPPADEYTDAVTVTIAL